MFMANNKFNKNNNNNNKNKKTFKIIWKIITIILLYDKLNHQVL